VKPPAQTAAPFGFSRVSRSHRKILAVMAITVFALVLTAATASAAPSSTVGAVSAVSYTSVHVTGTVGLAGEETYYSFEYSTDDANWSSFNFEGPLDPEGGESQSVALDRGGLQPGTKYYVRLAVVHLDELPQEFFSPTPDKSFTTLAVAKPTVLATNDATAVTYTTAQVSGEVQRPANPDPAFDTNCTFEYVAQAQFAATGFEGAGETACNPSPITTAGVSSVSAQLTGLARGTTYHLRITAGDAGGSSFLEAADTFTTTTTPLAQTLSPEKVQLQAATLAARINPANAPVTYQFQWGPTSSYGSTAPATATTLSAADESFHTVTAPITGLAAGGTYHYRISATNTQTNETVEGIDQTFTTGVSVAAATACPNESSRVGLSANLPDCRAYEYATPGLNGATLGESAGGYAREDGTAVGFRTIDAPLNAQNSSVADFVVSKRGPQGWETESVLPPVVEKIDGFNSSGFLWGSEDLTQEVVFTPQALAGNASPAGLNMYLRRPDKTFVPITQVGAPYYPVIDVYQDPLGIAASKAIGASKDFTHIFYQSVGKQLASDPVESENTYEWVNGTLSLVGILPGPGQTPAPNGATLAVAGAAQHRLLPFSDDGRKVIFTASGFPGLYLRIDAARTVEVSASQRSVDPDPEPNATVQPVGITGDGSKVFFISKSELTNDADTGATQGSPNHRGADLYSYDVETEKLTDLTVDSKLADQETGADVQRVVGTDPDGSFIYFVARGDLAPGGALGEENLYVEHEGEIDFIAPAAGMFLYPGPTSYEPSMYVTPDGHYAAFVSTGSLTGYENAGQPEIFKYTYKHNLVCVSCRPNDKPATGAASPLVGRAVSDDGSRVFFQSSDAVLPQASNGRPNVYEYERGEVRLLSPGDGDSKVLLIDASGSGDDVFVDAHAELTPDEQGAVDAIYDVRVNADVAKATPVECQESCRSSLSQTPAFGAPSSVLFSGPGNAGPPPAVKSVKPKSKETAKERSKRLVKALKACKKKPKKSRASCEKKARKQYGKGK
jgi:hypothetical protein